MSVVELQTILDLIKNDDKYGLELLYKNHYRFIYGTAFSVLKNEENAKEVVQNVMIKLIGLKKESFPKKGELSWLFTVIRNEALMLLRKESRQSPIDEFPDIPVMDMEINDLVDMDAYYSLIKSLNEKQKEVVTLKVLGGLSHKEIAQAIGKPIGTVQWIYNTSIKQLRVALSSMASFVFVIIASLIGRYNIWQTQNNVEVPELGGEEMIPIEPLSIWSDKIFIALFIVLIVLIIGVIIFYKNTDKLPTKHKV